MRLLDTPIRIALGRTPRELVLLACGVGYCAYELLTPPANVANLLVYTTATLAFALRFFPARALGVGVALGALAQRLPDLRLGVGAVETPHVWIAAAVIALLASSDLERRFDRAPSRLAWLPNRWADLPPRDVRVLRACTYAVGALLALVVMDRVGGRWSGATLAEGAAGPLVVAAALTAILLALAAGRAVALLAVPVVGATVALGAALEVPRAEAALAGRLAWSYGARPVGYPQDALPLVALALFAAALALPHAVRLVRNVMLAQRDPSA